MKNPEFIMLVDDNDATNYYHHVIIGEAGIETRVLSFTYAEKALNHFFVDQDILLKVFPSGIIFLDINMPGMNGWDFLDEFEKLPVELKAKIVIIVLTTSDNPLDFEKAGKIPSIKGFMPKPLSEETLKEVINTYLSPTC